MTSSLGVAVIGGGMAGRAHAAGYRTATTLFGTERPDVRLVAIADTNAAVADDTAWRQQPITEIDRIAGEHRLAHLKADWPFQPEATAVSLPPPRTRVEQIALELFEKKLSWTGAMRELLAFYRERKDLERGAQAALNLAGVFSYVLDFFYSHYAGLKAWVITVQVVSIIVSGAVLGGALAYVIGRGIIRTGVLKTVLRDEEEPET